MLILKGPKEPVQALVFAPDAATLFAVHSRIGVHAWNLADRTCAALDIDGRRVHGEFAVHADGRWAFGTQRGGVIPHCRVLDLGTKRSRASNFIGVVGQHIAFAPGGQFAVTVGHTTYETRAPAIPTYRLYGWKLTAAGPRAAWHRDIPKEADTQRVAYLTDDTLVTVDHIPHGPNLAGHQPTIPRLALRSVADGAPRKTFESPQPFLEQLLAAPDGSRVVVRRGTALWVWESGDWGKPPRAVEGKYAKFMRERAACFHPFAPYLLLANNGPSVLVYDTATWNSVRKWKWDAGGVLRAVAVSRDGTLAAAAGTRGVVVVWDLDL
jgi:hypothetical protein